MEPLRTVEVIPAGEFSRTHEMELAPSDWEIPTRRQAEAYLTFLDSLEPLERRILAEDIAPTETGRIAERVGIDDVTTTDIGICGATEPYKWKDSAQVKATLGDLENRWEAASVKAKVARSKDKQSYKFPQDQDRIQLGFNRLVTEIIYGDYRDGRLTERPYEHIIELVIDSTGLRELVNRWYDEKYEARKVARAADLGSTATEAAKGRISLARLVGAVTRK